MGSTPRSPDSNEEAIAAWDGPLFGRFLRFREILTTGLGAHGEQAQRLHPPQPANGVLDVGCGFARYHTADRRAGRYQGKPSESMRHNGSFNSPGMRRTRPGSRTSASTPSTCRRDSRRAGFDYAFSRLGTMFFANPVVALRNVRKALVPRGWRCMVVWRRKLDNDRLHRAETVVARYLEHNYHSNEPICAGRARSRWPTLTPSARSS